VVKKGDRQSVIILHQKGKKGAECRGRKAVVGPTPKLVIRSQGRVERGKKTSSDGSLRSFFEKHERRGENGRV